MAFGGKRTVGFAHGYTIAPLRGWGNVFLAVQNLDLTIEAVSWRVLAASFVLKRARDWLYNESLQEGA
jgi:hypothetical protein